MTACKHLLWITKLGREVRDKYLLLVAYTGKEYREGLKTLDMVTKLQLSEPHKSEFIEAQGTQYTFCTHF